MSDDSSGEKTEEPTDKKINDSRKEGQVWKSKDMSSVAIFLVGMGAVKGGWDVIEGRMRDQFTFAFDHIAHPGDLTQATYEALLMMVTDVVIISLPVLLGTAVIGGLVDFLMIGPLFTTKPVMPKFDKLNPIEGAKNMFSKKQLVEMLKSMLKISITGYVAYGVVRNALPLIATTLNGSPDLILGVMGELVYRLSVRVGLIYVVFAIFDTWFQRHNYYKDMMMTKDEVKREYKESEGDPHHKAKRRELHMEILEGAQMEAVKSADVVVTNPEHFAIAIKYDKERDGAPRVIAKGIDAKALSIKELARGADVPTLRNVPLAHALFRVDVGQEIPEGLYDAVAEVLNFVYGLQQSQVGNVAQAAAAG